MTLVIGLGLTCHHIHYFPTTKDTRILHKDHH